MRLTEYTDYSLRALIHLGLNRDKLVTIQEIADTYGISKSHLMKVVHHLGLAGYVDTIRGRSGGLRLKREPEDINIGDVVRRTEPDFNMAECFNRERSTCTLAPVCELKNVLRRATAAYLDVLKDVTLADLLRNENKLRKLSLVQFQSFRRT